MEENKNTEEIKDIIRDTVADSIRNNEGKNDRNLIGDMVGGAITSSPKIILIIAAVVIGLLGSTFFCYKMGWFIREPLSIEKTANIVEEVKKIGEFTSAVYYEELALRDSYVDRGTIMGRDAATLASKATKKIGLGFASNLAERTTAVVANSSNEIVLIGKGRVRAGFDLAKLQEGDFNVHGDTLVMTLPPAEVFDIIMNPSDFTIEYESGTWSHELTKPIKERAKLELEQNAIENGILAKAEESGKKRLETLFRSFGFNAVILNVRQQ